MVGYKYPKTRKGQQIENFHGTPVADPYRWLEDLNSRETNEWISEQNALTYDFLEKIATRDSIQKRLTTLWNFPKSHAPFKKGGRYFQFRNNGLQNQDVLYVMDKITQTGSILLDPNTLSDDGTVALTDVKVCWVGVWVAYGTCASGSDWRTWHVRNIANEKDTNDLIEWSKFATISWLPTNDGFYYARYAEPEKGTTYAGTNTNQHIYLHILGTPQSEDRLPNGYG